MVLAVARAWPGQDATVFPPRQLSDGESLSPQTQIKKQNIPSPDAPGHGRLSGMETITRQVGEMQAPERSAAELLLGHRLRGHEQLILQVLELDVTVPLAEDSRPAQTLEDWVHVYDGLSDEEIEKIDAIAKNRANLTRDLP